MMVCVSRQNSKINNIRNSFHDEESKKSSILPLIESMKGKIL
jgi:hypothetical protein